MLLEPLKFNANHIGDKVFIRGSKMRQSFDVSFLTLRSFFLDLRGAPYD